MSYRSGYGGGFPSKKPIPNNQTKQGYSMNAVPPPSSLTSGGRHSGGGGGGGYHQNFRKNTINASSSSSSNVSSGGGGGDIDGSTTSSSSNISKHGYSTMDAIAQFANCSQYAVGSKRKTKTEDEYFDDDEETTTDLAYIPAPGSPSASRSGYNRGDAADNSSDDDEEDPLDAFMSGLEKNLEKENTKKSQTQSSNNNNSNSNNSSNIDYNPKKKGVRTDIDDEDDEESYYRYMEENPNAGVIDEGSDNEIEYDEDGNPIAPARRRDIDPLPAIDHTEIEYKPFEKNFYEPHEEIAGLSRSKVDDLRHTLGIRVTGPVPPKPVVSFAHFGFDETLMKQIRKSEYIQPTAIQSQAIPAAMSGRDLIGIAKTGSGKTAAFIWPMLVHIMDQRELQLGDGPIGLILAPTRELSLQIYNETKKFGKIYNINVVCCYGGGSKWEQSKALEQGAEVVVATPGRMIDMVKMKATNLRRVTYLVLDEADRMFNMGFEPQVRSICNHVRPDRQTMLFSATFKKRIEKLARDVLTDPVRIVQGDLGEANEDITQHMIVFTNPAHKWNWLLAKLVEFLSSGSVLIFVTKKADAETVANNLQLNEYEAVLLHGDMDQADRNKVIMQFKRKEVPLMVATDVAARGLDIPHIKTVVNYDIARDIDTHTHRIGRTGRAGEKGTAYTLVIEKDKEFAGHLVRNLEGANQEVPEALLELAMQSSWFRKSRFKCGKGKSVAGIGGAGLGYRERPSFSGGGGGGGSDGAASSNETSGGGGGKGKGVGGGNNYDTGRNNNESGPAPKSSTKGPITNRFLAMKETFRSQYNSQFRASSDRTWEQTVPETGVFIAPSLPPPPPPPPPSKMGTVGTNRKHSQSSSSSNSSQNDNNDVDSSANKPVKRNRWN